MKSQRVRILVAITDDGTYRADGSSDVAPQKLIDGMNEWLGGVMTPPIEFFWIEADVPVPAPLDPPVIRATEINQKGARRRQPPAIAQPARSNKR